MSGKNQLNTKLKTSSGGISHDGEMSMVTGLTSDQNFSPKTGQTTSNTKSPSITTSDNVPTMSGKSEINTKHETASGGISHDDEMSTVTDLTSDQNINPKNGQTTSGPKSASITSSENVYNILLLGETGVGKSTFINAFVNYVSYGSLDEAINAKEIISLIPSRFIITDEDFKSQQITFGEDKNESNIVGASATQRPRSYKFNFGNVVMRIIDTPGVGDTRGIHKDEYNFDIILKMIGSLENIHAICIMLKPNNARLNILFEYCIKQLLSRLQRDASQNIVFLFTNSRNTFYRPGDTVEPLNIILKQIASNFTNIVIPFNKSNTFCLDNEAFRFLVATRKGIIFSDEDKEDFSRSWQKSATTCLSFLNYIVKLPPHKIQDTVSVNEARRLIMVFSKPLAEITENINVNIRNLSKQQAYLTDNTRSKAEHEKDLYIQLKKLKIKSLNQPSTVCTELSCTTVFKDKGLNRYHYEQKCHDPCYLENIPEETVGSVSLIYCTSMKNGVCVECNHSYAVHMHIYYTTEEYTETVEDDNTKRRIEQDEEEIDRTSKTIRTLEDIVNKYKMEKRQIQKAMAKFAHFLKNNAIATYNDKYKEYLLFLIEREKKSEQTDEVKELIKSYEHLVQVYEEEKKVLDDVLTSIQETNADVISVVSSNDIINSVNELYNLEEHGNKIKEFYKAQEPVMKSEILEHTEKVTILEKTIAFFYDIGKSIFSKKRQK